MFEKITFYIHEKQLEINDHVYSLGELTTDCLNIAPEEYREMKALLDDAEKHFEKYNATDKSEDWWCSNEALMTLDTQLMKYKIFQAIRDPEFLLLDEVKEKTGQKAFFETPDNFLSLRQLYEIAMEKYDSILHDIRACNTTIHNFINIFLSHLKKLDSENYAAAWFDFITNPNREKLIYNPVRNDGIFYADNFFSVRYEPREDAEGRFHIYEEHTSEMLQSLLQTDFMKALTVKHVIRRCDHCGRYFLLKTGHHTKYCDLPAPENSKFTCNQMGYRSRGVKETARDNPKHGSLLRALSRIEKDYSRKIITETERNDLFKLSRDLYNESMTSTKYNNDDFEELLQSEKLYTKLGIVRKTKPRGRPKKASE